jgi:hypothetical protein
MSVVKQLQVHVPDVLVQLIMDYRSEDWLEILRSSINKSLYGCLWYQKQNIIIRSKWRRFEQWEHERRCAAKITMALNPKSPFSPQISYPFFYFLPDNHSLFSSFFILPILFLPFHRVHYSYCRGIQFVTPCVNFVTLCISRFSRCFFYIVRVLEMWHLWHLLHTLILEKEKKVQFIFLQK